MSIKGRLQTKCADSSERSTFHKGKTSRFHRDRTHERMLLTGHGGDSCRRSDSQVRTRVFPKVYYSKFLIYIFDFGSLTVGHTINFTLLVSNLLR